MFFFLKISVNRYKILKKTLCILIKKSTLHLMNKLYICRVMGNDIDFNAYLISKKIDPGKFKNTESEAYQKLASVFEHTHPDSFTAQKLFLINPIRRKYLLEEQNAGTSSKLKTKFKPKIR